MEEVCESPLLYRFAPYIQWKPVLLNHRIVSSQLHSSVVECFERRYTNLWELHTSCALNLNAKLVSAWRGHCSFTSVFSTVWCKIRRNVKLFLQYRLQLPYFVCAENYFLRAFGGVCDWHSRQVSNKSQILLSEVHNMQLYGLWALYMVRKNAVSFTSVQSAIEYYCNKCVLSKGY